MMYQPSPSLGPLVGSPMASPWTQAITNLPSMALGGIPPILGNNLNIVGPSRPIGNNMFITPVVATPFSASPQSILVQTIEEMGNQPTQLPPSSAYSSTAWPFIGVPPWMAAGTRCSSERLPKGESTPIQSQPSDAPSAERPISSKPVSSKPILSATVAFGVSPIFPQSSSTPRFVAYGLDQNSAQHHLGFEQLWTPISYASFQQLLNENAASFLSPTELLLKAEEDAKELRNTQTEDHHSEYSLKDPKREDTFEDKHNDTPDSRKSFTAKQNETTVKLTNPPKVIPRRGRPPKRPKTSNEIPKPKAKRAKVRVPVNQRTGAHSGSPKSADLYDPELAQIFSADEDEVQPTPNYKSKIASHKPCHSHVKKVPKEDRYWLDQQASYMADLKSKGFEAIQIPGNRYKCSLCSQIFATKLLCIRHAVEHLSYKPFRCLGCGAEFTRCDTLQRHLKGRCPVQNLGC